MPGAAWSVMRRYRRDQAEVAALAVLALRSMLAVVRALAGASAREVP